MSKSGNEKQKILYILKILEERTDEEHRMSIQEIIDALGEYGIGAERKSVYRDLDCLEEFGYDIIRSRLGCCLASRTFEIAELKLLADAVQASPIITGTKTKALIEKLSSFAGPYNSAKLNRGISSDKRSATGNEAVYYSIDVIHSALSAGHKVAFCYFDWTPEKKQVLRRGGSEYLVSPWGLWWDNERYYLIAYDSEADQMKTYRVDKMKKARETDEAREGSAAYRSLDMSVYSKKMFGMYGGEECTVTLECENSLAGVVIDRFGRDVSIIPGHASGEGGGYFTFRAPVMLSNNFYSWVLQFGGRMRITEPEDARRGMKELLRSAAAQY